MLIYRNSFGSLSMTETPIPLSDIMNLDSFLTILWRISFAKIDDAFSDY